MGGSCSNNWSISFFLPLYSTGPTFHDTAFASLSMQIDPDILRFKSQPVLDIWSSLVVLNSLQRFHPVRIGSKLTCFFLAYVPQNPNMFSASAPSSIMSLLSRFWIQEPMLVLRARKNSTINFQECLGTWVRHCQCVAPSGMASQCSTSENQSLLLSWRVLIRGIVRTNSVPAAGALSGF